MAERDPDLADIRVLRWLAEHESLRDAKARSDAEIFDLKQEREFLRNLMPLLPYAVPVEPRKRRKPPRRNAVPVVHIPKQRKAPVHETVMAAREQRPRRLEKGWPKPPEAS